MLSLPTGDLWVPMSQYGYWTLSSFLSVKEEQKIANEWGKKNGWYEDNVLAEMRTELDLLQEFNSSKVSTDKKL